MPSTGHYRLTLRPESPFPQPYATEAFGDFSDILRPYSNSGFLFNPESGESSVDLYHIDFETACGVTEKFTGTITRIREGGGRIPKTGIGMAQFSESAYNFGFNESDEEVLRRSEVEWGMRSSYAARSSLEDSEVPRVDYGCGVLPIDEGPIHMGSVHVMIPLEMLGRVQPLIAKRYQERYMEARERLKGSHAVTFKKASAEAVA